MGITPLTWQEIEAWYSAKHTHTVVEYVSVGDDQFVPVTRTECSLDPFELQAIKVMSQEYAVEYGQASEKDRPAPYNTVEIEEQSFKVGKSMLKSLLGANATKNSEEPKYEVELRED